MNMENKLDYILYVDDELLNLEIFKAFLENDYNVLIESSTTKASEILKQYPVKVIVSDQRMPEESGLEFLQRIHPIYPDIVKIIFTAFVDSDTTIQAINQGGIFRFLKKPWDTNEMKQALYSAITEFNLKAENKKLLKELKQKNDELEVAFSQISEKEKKFYSIFSNSNDGIVIIKNNRMLEANSAFLNFLDIESIDPSVDDINSYVTKKYFHLIARLGEQLPKEGAFIQEVEIINKKNEKRYFQLNSKLIDFENGEAILSMVRDTTELKQLDFKIMDAIVRTQEDAQTYYARELHDGLGPNLSTLKMYIEWISDSKNTMNKEIITQQAILGIDEAINMLKDIANNLSPHILKNFGLVNAIKTFAEKIQLAKGVEIIISSNLTSRLPENYEIHLYRILLECINNSIKHGNSKKIIIKFSKADNVFQILYCDNGKGFDVDKVKQEKKGMGLYNMINRVKLMSGDINIKSNLNIGTDIQIKIILS